MKNQSITKDTLFIEFNCLLINIIEKMIKLGKVYIHPTPLEITHLSNTFTLAKLVK